MKHPEQDLIERFEMQLDGEPGEWRIYGLNETVYDADGNAYDISCVIKDTDTIRVSYDISPAIDVVEWSCVCESVNQAIHEYYFQLLSPRGFLAESKLFRDIAEIDLSALAESGLYD